MELAKDIKVGDIYLTYLTFEYKVKVVGINNDFCIIEYISKRDEPCEERSEIVHKALLYEMPKKWDELPNSILIGLLRESYAWYSDAAKLFEGSFSRFNGYSIDKNNKMIFDNLYKEAKKQSRPNLLKAISKTASFSECLNLSHLYTQTDYCPKKKKYVKRLDNISDFNKEKKELEEALTYIWGRRKYLEANYPDDLLWQMHFDPYKLDHYKYHLNKLLVSDRFLSIDLFSCPKGNIRCFDSIRLCSKSNAYQNDLKDNLNTLGDPKGSSRDTSFQEVLSYILDNGIFTNTHNSEIEVPDFINKDSDNPRMLKKSVKVSGFGNYLIYLTAKDLKEIYKKIRSRYSNKAAWAFIKASDNDTKFYMLIS